MKCLVMAGGAGNRLWPLSRREYPKQFVDLRGGRSMFQETIARNLPFCDEFWIATTAEYHHIVEFQLKAFQNLKYRCFLEESPRRTAPVTALACLCANPSEMILFVSTDHIIEGSGYRTAVISAIELMKRGRMACFGVLPTSTCSEHGMLTTQNSRVICHERVSEAQADELIQKGGWYWDCGIQAFRAGDFLQEFRHFYPAIFKNLSVAAQNLDRSGRNIVIPTSCMRGVPSLGIGEGITGKSEKMSLIPCAFQWKRIMNLQALAEYYDRESVGPAIVENCENVSVINYSARRLAVVNDVQNAVVIQTDDAIYITSKHNSQQIREIGLTQDSRYQHFFEKGTSSYYEWGTCILLRSDPYTAIRRFTVFPVMSVPARVPSAKSCQLICITGEITVSINGELSQLAEGASMELPRGVAYAVMNSSHDDQQFLEVDVAPAGAPTAVSDILPVAAVPIKQDAIIRMDPTFKDNIWGGDRLRTRFGKKCDYEVIGESWELSAHKAGQSTVGTGAFSGMLFSEYIERIGHSAMGWKCSSRDRFPLLIKFIDAHDRLSVQVHPNDEYALQHENDYGKSEMWHIIDSEPDSYIYYGFNRNVTREEVRAKAQDSTLVEILNKVPVRAGEDYFIPAGTVHAIGPGVLLCEIQQSSDVTFRLFDYNRTDRYGNHRELHLTQALDVLDYHRLERMEIQPVTLDSSSICSCKYFSSIHLKVQGQTTIHVDNSSFTALVFLGGSGFVTVGKTTLQFREADTFFIPAAKQSLEIRGDCELLQVHI